jgi:hypothetical protein
MGIQQKEIMIIEKNKVTEYLTGLNLQDVRMQDENWIGFLHHNREYEIPMSEAEYFMEQKKTSISKVLNASLAIDD